MVNNSKKINLSFSDKIKNKDKYELFLVKTNEEQLEIHFANLRETNTEINLDVVDIVTIPAEKMKDFCYDIIDALLEYEETYKNGFGLSKPEK